MSLGLTLGWLGIVVGSGTLDRALDHWESATTMLFGSFLAGSSPEGGGAVAFPVFTKALEVPAEIARTFGLCIQAVGMTVAVIAILLYRRPIHVRTAVLASGGAIVGFVVAAVTLGEPDRLFWPATFANGWTKATFSIVLATTSIMMIRRLRVSGSLSGPARWTGRHDIGVALASLAGGVLSSLAGTGANIVVFLFLVVLADVDAKVALPTAIVVMASVSLVGLALFGLADGQLLVDVEAGRVVEVGDQAADLPAGEADLLGLWMAAISVVVWGAPLGSWAAARVREPTLVGFVAVLAAVEVITTFLLVDDLTTNLAMFV